jgi:hypothetical protein
MENHSLILPLWMTRRGTMNRIFLQHCQCRGKSQILSGRRRRYGYGGRKEGRKEEGSRAHYSCVLGWF